MKETNYNVEYASLLKCEFIRLIKSELSIEISVYLQINVRSKWKLTFTSVLLLVQIKKTNTQKETYITAV